MDRTNTAYNNLITEFSPAVRQMLHTGRGFSKSFQTILLPMAESYFSALSTLAFSAQVSSVDLDGETKRIGNAILQITRVFKESLVQLQKLCKIFESEFMAPIEKDLTINSKKYSAMYKKFKINSRDIRKPVEKLLTKKQKEGKKLFAFNNTQKESQRLQIIADCEQRLKEFEDYELAQAQILERQAFGMILDRLQDVTGQTALVVEAASEAFAMALPSANNFGSRNSNDDSDTRTQLVEGRTKQPMQDGSIFSSIEQAANSNVPASLSGGKPRSSLSSGTSNQISNNGYGNQSNSSSPSSHHRQVYSKQTNFPSNTMKHINKTSSSAKPMQISNSKSVSNIPSSVSVHLLQFPSANTQMNSAVSRANSFSSYALNRQQSHVGNTGANSSRIITDLAGFDDNKSTTAPADYATVKTGRLRTAVFNYEAQQSQLNDGSRQQLSFEIGDQLVPMGRDLGNGWQFGRNLSTNQYGWFPLSFTVLQNEVANNNHHQDESGEIIAGTMSDDAQPGGNSSLSPDDQLLSDFTDSANNKLPSDYSSLPATPPLSSPPSHRNVLYDNNGNLAMPNVEYSSKAFLNHRDSFATINRSNRQNASSGNISRRNSTIIQQPNEAFISNPMPTVPAPPPPPPPPPPPTIKPRIDRSESNVTVAKIKQTSPLKPAIKPRNPIMKDVFEELIAKAQSRLNKGRTTMSSGAGDGSDESGWSLSSTSSGMGVNTSRSDFPEPPSEFF